MLFDVYKLSIGSTERYYQVRSGMQIPITMFNDSKGAVLAKVYYMEQYGATLKPAYVVTNLNKDKLIAYLKLINQPYDDLKDEHVVLTHGPNRDNQIIIIR